MSLSDNEKEAMRLKTLPAARNLLDDLEFFREVFANSAPKRRHIRQMSVHLRKLLIDDQLRIVATPRVGRVCLSVPNNEAIFAGNASKCIVAIGLFRMFSNNIPVINYITRDNTNNDTNCNPRLVMLSGEKPVKLKNIDQFLAMPVLKYDGTIVNYGDIIKYICYHDFGAHFSGRFNNQFLALEKFRNVISIGFDGDHLSVVLSEIGSSERAGQVLDYPQAMLFSIAGYILNSPEIINLESLIRSGV